VSPAPNRRDEEVRRMLDGPHPMVPADLVPRAAARGRRTVRRRRVARCVLWALLLAAVVAGLVLAAVFWPDAQDPAGNPGGTWWAPAAQADAHPPHIR
jgi:hypothetical protein